MSKAKTVRVDASNEDVRQVEAVELLFNVANIGSKGDVVPDYDGSLIRGGHARSLQDSPVEDNEDFSPIEDVQKASEPFVDPVEEVEETELENISDDAEVKSENPFAFSEVKRKKR